MMNEAGSMSKAAVAAPEGAVDWRVLDELKVLQKPGAPDLRLRLMTMFLKSSPPLMEGIRTAVLTSDAQLLTMSAHTLKSTALSLGAMRLGAICADLEQIGRNNALQDLGDLPKEANGQFKAVIAAFQEVLRQSGA